MTLREVADYLKLSEQAVNEMAKAGQIPARKRAAQWQFTRAAVDEWRAHRGGASVADRPLPAEAAGIPEPLTVSSVILPARISTDLKATDKDRILRELTALVIDPREVRPTEILFQALKTREDLCPTCVSEGVAIPHARNALVGLVDKPVLAYGRHNAGVDFGALDGKPIHHFFLLCCPNVRQHLQLLSRLARLVNKPELRRQLSAAKDAKEVVTLIAAVEQLITS